MVQTQKLQKKFLVESFNGAGLGSEVRGQGVVSATSSSSVGNVDHTHTSVHHGVDGAGHGARGSAVSNTGESVLVTRLLAGAGGAGHPGGEVGLQSRGGVLEDHNIGRDSQVTLVGLGARVQDNVAVSTVGSDRAVHLLVVRDLAGGSGSLVDEDTLEARELSSIGVDIGGDVADGSGTIAGVDVSDHGDTGSG